MKVFKMISLLALSVFCNSCYVTSKHHPFEGFDYCYNNTKIQESKLIDFDSYYKMDYYSLNDGSVDHSRIFTFLEDGIYISSLTEDFIQKVERNGEWNSKFFSMGMYHISNDTIYAKRIHIGSTTSGCELEIYRIIDSKNLKRVFYGNCKSPPKAFLSTHPDSLASLSEYKYHPQVDEMWIKKKKWFWCSEDEYKKWKREQAILKKQKRKYSE